MKISIVALVFFLVTTLFSDEGSLNPAYSFFAHRRVLFEKQLREALPFNDSEQESKAKILCKRLTINDKLLRTIDNHYRISNLSKGEYHLNFDLRCQKNGNYAIYIRISDSPRAVYETIISFLSSMITHSNKMMNRAQAIPLSSDYHLGDLCAYSKGSYFVYCRANVGVVIFSSCQELSDFHIIAKPFDELIRLCLVPFDGNSYTPKLDFSSDYVNEQKSSNKYQRRHKADEVIEQRLKSLPKKKSQEYCLEKVIELSATPDKNTKELQFYIRGLPLMEENGTIKVLHRISDNAKDEQLLTATMRLQGKWLALFADQRSIVINDLSRKLKTDNRDLRKQAIASLGRAESLDALSILLREWETRPDDYDILKAIGKILGWPQEDAAWDEARLTRLKMTISAFLQALDKLHGGNASAHDKLE